MTVLTSLAHRLQLARLYLCTDARERQGDLREFLAAAFAGGVDVVQIRQPGLGREAELAALETAREAARPHQGIVSVHASAKLAGEFSADMLHLGRGDGGRPVVPAGGCTSGRSSAAPPPRPPSWTRRWQSPGSTTSPSARSTPPRPCPTPSRSGWTWSAEPHSWPPSPISRRSPGSRSAGSTWTRSDPWSRPAPGGWSWSAPSPRPTTRARPPPRSAIGLRTAWSADPALASYALRVAGSGLL